MSGTKKGARPRIGIVMDENTSMDGTRYDMSKSYFQAIQNAGGLPLGLPYCASPGELVDMFDGLISSGGYITFPDEWFVDGEASKTIKSERFAFELELLQAFLKQRKPVLGICHGMQMLSGLHGSRLTSDLQARTDGSINHCDPEGSHKVQVLADTLLHDIVGEGQLTVNSYHREAVVEPGPEVTVCARAEDGTVEAIELPQYSFVLGVQWHPERMLADAAAEKIFARFCQACSGET